MNKIILDKINVIDNGENKMSGKEIITKVKKEDHNIFEELKQIDKDGNEFWYARVLSKLLGYKDFRNFIKVIEKAKKACNNSNYIVSEHIVEVNEQLKFGQGAIKEYASFTLSRYACYLVVQNADPSKPIVANGQTYFAMQTRRQELQDDEKFAQLKEEEKRLFLRNELKEHNKQLVQTAQKAGVETHLDFAIFQNHGYQGLYGGLNAKDIHTKKGLKKSHKILDYMGSTELAANLFRATQAEEKLKRDNVQTKTVANKTHNEVGKKVRQTIQELGGTMPEDLPSPEKSILKIEKEQKKLK